MKWLHANVWLNRGKKSLHANVWLNREMGWIESGICQVSQRLAQQGAGYIRHLCRRGLVVKQPKRPQRQLGSRELKTDERRTEGTSNWLWRYSHWLRWGKIKRTKLEFSGWDLRPLYTTTYVCTCLYQIYQ